MNPHAPAASQQSEDPREAYRELELPYTAVSCVLDLLA
jgi:hypothetical protein